MAFNFKNEEDVKDYLKNIYAEYRFGCEKEKNANACHLYGDYLESIKKDYKEAASIYKANCDERNWSRSCDKFGGYKAIGKGCPASVQESFSYFRKACELGDAKGCVHAGTLATSDKYKFYEERKNQVIEAVSFLKKGCYDLEHEESCFYLSSVYLGALKNEYEPNFKEAYKLSLQCCEKGNPYACVNVSQMHERGEGAQKNDELAKAFRDRAKILYDEIKNIQKQVEFGQGIKV